MIHNSLYTRLILQRMLWKECQMLAWCISEDNNPSAYICGWQRNSMETMALSKQNNQTSLKYSDTSVKSIYLGMCHFCCICVLCLLSLGNFHINTDVAFFPCCSPACYCLLLLSWLLCEFFFFGWLNSGRAVDVILCLFWFVHFLFAIDTTVVSAHVFVFNIEAPKSCRLDVGGN